MRLSVVSHVEDVACSGGEKEERWRTERKGSVALRNRGPCRLTSPGGTTVCFPHPPEVCVEWAESVCVLGGGGYSLKS